MDDKAEKIALFRYGLIAPLVLETLPRGELTRRAQEITARLYEVGPPGRSPYKTAGFCQRPSLGYRSHILTIASAGSIRGSLRSSAGNGPRAPKTLDRRLRHTDVVAHLDRVAKAHADRFRGVGLKFPGLIEIHRMANTVRNAEPFEVLPHDAPRTSFIGLVIKANLNDAVPDLDGKALELK
jgi:hypothetical protein